MPSDLSSAFLLAFPALFSIVNPIAGAFIFGEVTGDRSHADRVRLARLVGAYSLLVMLGAYTFYFIAIMLTRARAEVLRRERGGAWLREEVTRAEAA